jgi:hypothetical protein
VLEAYWKSVHAPGEGVFIGEPLARPFGRDDVVFDADAHTLSITTNGLLPTRAYVIEAADSEAGPFTFVQDVVVADQRRTTLVVPDANAAVYRLRAAD